MRFAFRLCAFFSRVLLLAAMFLAYGYFSLPNVSSLKHVRYQEPLEILARDGTLIESFG